MHTFSPAALLSHFQPRSSPGSRSFADGQCPVFADSQSAMWAPQAGNPMPLPDQNMIFGDQQAAVAFQVQQQQAMQPFVSPNHPYPAAMGRQPNMPQPSQQHLEVSPPYPVDPSGARPMRAMEEHQQMMLRQQQLLRMRNPPQTSPYMSPQTQQVNPQAMLTQPQMGPGMSAMNNGFPPNMPCGAMIRAGPPMLYSQVQQQGQQKVTAFPNPHALPDSDSQALVALQNPLHQPAVVVLQEVILQPFMLDGAGKILNFSLNMNVVNAMAYPEVEIQLKAFLREDPQQQCNWPMPDSDCALPTSVTINGRSHEIQSRNCPLFIKRLCGAGSNRIQIISNNATQHFFTLQLINRQPLNALLSSFISAWQSNQMDLDKCRERAFQLTHAHGSKTEGLRVPLFCPVTKRRLCYPARSAKCSHMGCFEFEPFLLANRDETFYQCPLCRTPFMFHELKLDGYVMYLLQNTLAKPEALEVSLAPNGQWRLVEPNPPQFQPNHLKRHMSDQLGGGPGNMKRYRSENGVLARSDNVGPPQSVPTTAPGAIHGDTLLSPYGAPTSTGSPSISGLPKAGIAFPDMPMTPASSLTSSSPNGILAKMPQPEGTQPQASGSAPYTPASVGSVHSGVHSNTSNGLQTSAFNDLSSLATDDAEDLFSDFMGIDNVDYKRYLIDDLGEEYPRCPPVDVHNTSDDWGDIMQIVGQDR
ncbi:hypothetical protein L596_004759 [Steinernema carpocapsae]|uniref:SP-RING-type domain-containing protein n=1 Tax=Steinernema carpocapsae TaxID=34508 RepID=A0A4U8UWW6_STECR|nr:hypothetical protein L596_004759 [Steinernema carpocapsae]